jgi:hypothetical protein
MARRGRLSRTTRIELVEIMTPDRWKEVERLYHAALARPAAERTAYLADACGDDEALRHEVASLLEQPASADVQLATGAAAAQVAQRIPASSSATPDGRWADTGRSTRRFQLLRRSAPPRAAFEVIEETWH